MPQELFPQVFGTPDEGIRPASRLESYDIPIDRSPGTHRRVIKRKGRGAIGARFEHGCPGGGVRMNRIPAKSSLAPGGIWLRAKKKRTVDEDVLPGDSARRRLTQLEEARAGKKLEVGAQHGEIGEIELKRNFFDRKPDEDGKVFQVRNRRFVNVRLTGGIEVFVLPGGDGIAIEYGDGPAE